MDLTIYTLSILAMLSYGIAFFLLARTSKTIGALHSTFIFQLVGIPFFIFALPLGSIPPISVDYLAPIAVGIADAFVFIIFLHALKVGKVSIVSPIIDTYALFTFILGVIFLNESVVPMKVLGSILIVLGLVFISAKISRSSLKEAFTWESGSGYALLGAIGTGIFFLFVGITVQLVGWLANAFLIRVSIAATTLVILLLKGRKISSLFKNLPMKWILPAAILDVVGFSMYNIAVTRGEISVVTMITSAQTLMVVLLGWLILKEKMTRIQFVGLASIFAGLVFLNLI